MGAIIVCLGLAATQAALAMLGVIAQGNVYMIAINGLSALGCTFCAGASFQVWLSMREGRHAHF